MILSVTPSDYMARALFHAARGRGRTSPNPMVGAVVVTEDGVVVGQGHHERAGEAHAEIRALDMAGPRARGATLYCTLEPCSHTGRTGPCVVRILEAGIVRVVASVQDPDPRVSGRGFAFLQSHGIGVEIGPGALAATELNQPFFTLTRTGRPFVIMKAATSLDGCVAAAAGCRTRLTSAEAERHAHCVRAEVDAIGVGVGTVEIDDPLLTARAVYRPRPLTRVVFDRTLRMPPGARLLSTPDAGPVIIVTTAAGAAQAEARKRLEQRGAEIEVAADGTMRSAFARLGTRGIGSLLLEGGVAVHRSAWAEGVVDFVRVYVTPRAVGPSGLPWLSHGFSPFALHRRRVTPIGPDVIIEGYVHRPG